MNSAPVPRAFMDRASRVTLVYALATIALTWPLVTVMHRKIAGDLGDPLFNCWILLWTSGQVLQALHGHLGALANYWNGNIFYPTPLTLAFSEHLTPQMLQGLPILAATGNVLLTYNLLLMSTYVLSGLGMYLFVRDLTDEPVAAFLAGLAFAFAPYRIDQFSHLEVLSSQWMPFVLLGWRRFFVSGRWRPLFWGTIALVAQAASCGYYLAYFTLFAIAYCIYELLTRKKWHDGRTLGALAAAGIMAMLLMAPILSAYASVRRTSDLGVRDLQEIHNYSADTHGFATISANSRLWGKTIRAWPGAEDQGFPGFTILAFALVGVGAGLGRAMQYARRASVGSPPPWRRVIAAALVFMLTALLLVFGDLVLTGRITLWWRGSFFLFQHAASLLAPVALMAAALLLTSAFCRRVIRGVPGAMAGFFACATIASAWLSMGPDMFANGRPIGAGLYDVLYRWVPGFNGLRVPSLNFMLVAMDLAVLVGLGAAPILARWRRLGAVVVGLGAVLIVAESWMAPVPMNLAIESPGYPYPPTDIKIGAAFSPVYRAVRDLPAGAVLVEFPFGSPGYEIQYTFYAGYHRKPILNGYSGYYPGSYLRESALWNHVMDHPSASWDALVASGATHAIVHERAFAGSQDVSDWLLAHGAREILSADGDRLFQIR